MESFPERQDRKVMVIGPSPIERSWMLEMFKNAPQSELIPPTISPWISGLGIEVRTVPFPITKLAQFRFPRSKKKRIRMKWAKDFRNYKEFNAAIFLTKD